MNEIFTVKWLTPVVELLYSAHYSEALRLAEYYPNTTGRQLTQLAAELLEQNNWSAAGRAEHFSIQDRLEPRDFAHLMEKLSPRSLAVNTRRALDGYGNYSLHLAQILLEARLTVSDVDRRSLATDWMQLVAKARRAGLVDLTEAALPRALETESAYESLKLDPSRLSSEDRTDFFRALLNRDQRLLTAELAGLIEALCNSDLRLSEREIHDFWSSSQSMPPLLLEAVGRGLIRQRLSVLHRRKLTLDRARTEARKALGSAQVFGASGQTAITLSAILQSLIQSLTDWTSEPSPSHEKRVRRRFSRLVGALRRYARLSLTIEALRTAFSALLPRVSDHRTGANRWTLDAISDFLSRPLKRLPPFTSRWVDTFSGRVQSLLSGAREIDALKVSEIEAMLTSTSTTLDRHWTQLNDVITRLEMDVKISSRQTNDVFQSADDITEEITLSAAECLAPGGALDRVIETLPVFDMLIETAKVAVFGRGEYYAESAYAPVASPSEAVESRDRESLSVLESISKRAVQVERFTRIRLPEICSLHDRIQLRIQLTKDVPLDSRLVERLQVSAKRYSKAANVTVAVTAPGFALQVTRKRITVPIGEDSEEANFSLYAEESGPQVVEIEFFQARKRIGHALLKLNVLASADFGFLTRSGEAHALETYLKLREQSAEVCWLREPALNDVSDIEAPPANRLLHVTWLDRENKLKFALPSSGTPDISWEKGTPTLKSEIEDYLRDLNAFLTDAVSQGSPSDDLWRSINMNLRGVAGSLFDQVIPEDLKLITKAWSTGEVLAISTNEQWIPWELLFDGQDFWGKKFIVTRYPRLIGHRTHASVITEQKSARPVRRIVNVIGGGIPAFEKENATKLFEEFIGGVIVDTLSEKPLAVLSDSLPKADLLHFTCHGHLAPHMLRLSDSESQVENLLVQTVKQLPLEQGSLVFANACSSAAAAVLFGSFSTFGWEFYLRGAAAFVGTLGAVPAKHAVSFARNVYRELRTGDRVVTLGYAVAQAKRAAEQEKNVFWLLYCLYGDPDYRVEIHTTSSV